MYLFSNHGVFGAHMHGGGAVSGLAAVLVSLASGASLAPEKTRVETNSDSSSSVFTGSSSRKQLYFPAKEPGIVAMKYMLNLYVLGVVLTLLSIFVRLMESLGGLLETPLPGSSWITRGQLANTQPPKGLPDHPSRGVQ